ALMSTASLVTPILSEIWVDYSAIRYELPWFLIPALVVCGVVLQRLWSEDDALGIRASAACIGIVIVASAAINVQGAGNVAGAETSIDAGVAPIAAHLSGAGTDAVLAQYWMAKPLLYVTGYQLNVCQITDQGDVYPWIADAGWCVTADRAMRGSSSQVAVVDYNGFLQDVALEQRYGKPERITVVAGQRVLYFAARSVEPKLREELCALIPSLREASRSFGCR
ncbi:MAG: hypothetical protein ACRENA_00140, partial [Vulcanimicrobiaceae bacterium]